MSKNEKNFKVDGMKCGGCVTSVSKAINELPEVVECNINLEQGTAIVTGAVSADDVIDAIIKAGFKASLID